MIKTKNDIFDDFVWKALELNYLHEVVCGMGNVQLSVIKYWAIQMLELKHSAHMGTKSFCVDYSYT